MEQLEVVEEEFVEGRLGARVGQQSIELGRVDVGVADQGSVGRHSQQLFVRHRLRELVGKPRGHLVGRELKSLLPPATASSPCSTR